MIELLLISIGISLGIGISWLFRYKLNKAINKNIDIFEEEMEQHINIFNDDIDTLQEEIIYLEKIIFILNDQIDILLEEGEINSNENKEIKMNIDDILDKINKEGMGSLTKQQKDFLDKYSK